MSVQKTKIEWADASWNPVRGCSRVSEGCRNCYAERQAARFAGPGGAYEGLVEIGKSGSPRWTGVVRVVEEALEAPLRWKKPRRIFVNSMSDLFHEGLDEETIIRIFDVMIRILRETSHTFIILTKRAERMREVLRKIAPLHEAAHIWLGVSVEDQETANARIPLLLATPAALRFVSYEPALGPVDFRQWLPGIRWLIAGGESGPGARPSHPDWYRSVRDQCVAAGVPFFFKQWGEWEAQSQSPGKTGLGSSIHKWDGKTGDCLVSFRVGKKKAGRLLDGREWSEFPAEGRG